MCDSNRDEISCQLISCITRISRFISSTYTISYRNLLGHGRLDMELGDNKCLKNLTVEISFRATEKATGEYS
jgi:hypothetical protein